MRALHVAVAVLVVPALGAAYQADLVPASRRIEARDISGTLSISATDGTVHVTISDVNDAHGDSFNGQVTVPLRLRLNGAPWHVTIPVQIEEGDGEATQSLGLVANDQIMVRDARVRGPDRRTLAAPGVVTGAVRAAPPPPPPPPPPDQCPAALASCQSDLAECNVELDDCESQ